MWEPVKVFKAVSCGIQRGFVPVMPVSNKTALSQLVLMTLFVLHHQSAEPVNVSGNVSGFHVRFRRGYIRGNVCYAAF
jgi:hypothetical protein